MSKSLSATFERAPTSARRGGEAKNQVQLQEPEAGISASAPPCQSSGAPRHVATGPALAAVLSASLPAPSTTATDAPRVSPLPEPVAADAALQSPILTVDELAVLLRLNRKTVYDALSRGDIPGARRVGGTYRILRVAVIDWLASGQGRVSHSKRLR